MLQMCEPFAAGRGNNGRLVNLKHGLESLKTVVRAKVTIIKTSPLRRQSRPSSYLKLETRNLCCPVSLGK
jgi:hypothetical protein